MLSGPSSRVFSPDPRLALALAAFFSVLVWQAGSAALCAYLLVGGIFFFRCGIYRRWGRGALQRTLGFACFWPLLRLLLEAVRFFWFSPPSGFSGGGLGAYLAECLLPGLVPAGRESAVLFLRLLLLMGGGLALTALVSARGMGLACNWLLRPLAPQNGWQAGLALALMAQYLPLAHTALERTRTAARARGLRASGLAYWRIALPQIFRLLVEYPNKQALALTTRGLDAPEAWVLRQPFLGAEVAAAAAIVACAAVLAFFV